MKTMKKFKIKFLFIASLVLALILSFSIALAVEQNDVQNQVQDQVKNQEQNGKATNSESGNKNEQEFDGAEHQSVVATFVKSISEVANKEQKDIGEEVRVIAKEQNDIKDKVVESVDKINKRNKIKTFLIGTDYKNIGQLRSEMVKTTNQIDQLKKLQDKLKSEENKTVLQAQTKALETEQQKIEDFIKTNESKFSLFGWLVKLFNK